MTSDASSDSPSTPGAPYVVISGDTHGGAGVGAYRDYLDPEEREGFDEWRAAYANPSKKHIGGKKTKNWDSGQRAADLAGDGVVAEVIFPNTVPPFYETAFHVSPTAKREQYTRWRAGTRAHNRWLADFCADSPAPERHAGLALVAVVEDVAAAVEEIEWARNAGLRGVILRSQPISGPGWHHPRYEPIWEVCESLAMPIHTHGGESLEYGDLPASRSIFFTEVCWFAHRIFWFLLWAGVFERHPGLRLVLAEQFADWIPDLLHQLDAQYEGGVSDMTRPEGLTMRPSEYWARQCSVGASFMSRRECERRHAIGVPNILWGSDFPHDEGTWPQTWASLHDTFDGVPEPELRAMLGENAARVYGFDRAKLATHAARVGPSLEDFEGN